MSRLKQPSDGDNLLPPMHIRRVLANKEIVDAGITYSGVKPEEHDILGESLLRYVEARFPEEYRREHLGDADRPFSFHIGPGRSSLPRIDALCGCEVIVSEPDLKALGVQDRLRRSAEPEIASACGHMFLFPERAAGILMRYDSRIDHLTARNVFDRHPMPEVADMILNAVKHGGTVLVDSEHGRSGFTGTRSTGGERTLLNAAERNPRVRLEEQAELAIPTGFNVPRDCKLFKVIKD